MPKIRNKSMERAARRLLPEMANMAGLQRDKIARRLRKAPSRAVDVEATVQIRKRHARRKVRRQQKASRQRNRR